MTDLEKEKEELGELINIHEALVEHNTPVQFRPNRQQRRAASRQSRKKGARRRS